MVPPIDNFIEQPARTRIRVGLAPAQNAVYSLVEMGKIYRTNPEEKGRGVIAVYALVEDGEVYRTNPNESGRGVEALYDLTKNKDENE